MNDPENSIEKKGLKTESRSNDLQKRLFMLIQDVTSDKISLVYELSDLLGISMDSVYRRMRCETPLNIYEIQTLCSHYNISFDSVCELEQTGLVSFRFEPIREIPDFMKYLVSIRDALGKLSGLNTHIYYAAIDIPIFHNFRFPLVSYFKSFYWLKSISGNPKFHDLKFSCDHISKEMVDLGKEIHELYAGIPSTEIWTDLILNSLLRQIDYYWDSSEFAGRQDALQLLEQVSEEFNYMNEAARLADKSLSGTPKQPDNFSVYFCDIEIANNCIVVDTEKHSMVYLSTHTFNKILTSNALFTRESRNWIDGLISKSLLISSVGEKQRSMFFKNARTKIEAIRQKIMANGIQT